MRETFVKVKSQFVIIFSGGNSRVNELPEVAESRQVVLCRLTRAGADLGHKLVVMR